MKYRLALIGFGGVNRALVALIAKEADYILKTSGVALQVVAVSDIYLGSIYDPNGLDLQDLQDLPTSRGAFGDLPGGSAEPNTESLIQNSNADIVVEATFTNPETGEPALSYCRDALHSGKHVVTTNKGPVALCSQQLSELASKNNVHIEYEGTVMSGTPVLRMVESCLVANKVSGFRGILNGTANYILERVEQGGSVADAIKEAQALGYAEADPSADIEGFDVMLKVVILANELLGGNLTTSDVSREGITSLTDEQIRAARDTGERWKLIGSAVRDDDGNIQARVSPIKLSDADILSGVSGPTNAICLQTELLGEVMISGPGAGKIETAYALLSDIIAIDKKSATKASQTIV